MSYSRWGSRGSGHWYTYWFAQDDKIETRDNALFDVCAVAMFRAKDLRDDIDSCLAIVAKEDISADKHKLNELKTYMLEFLAEVDATYNKNT